MSSEGEEVALDTVLESSISATATGGLMGGFPVVFTSSSLQLGSEPAGIVAKFVDTEYSEEIYVLPDVLGDKQRTHLLLCAPALDTAKFNADAAPRIFGQAPTTEEDFDSENGADSSFLTAVSSELGLVDRENISFGCNWMIDGETKTAFETLQTLCSTFE